MDIDPYAPCPGGTGKKLKFCCSDLTADLDKLSRMVSGDQRAAALELVENLDEKYPDRACLLSTKAMLQAELGQPEKAAATIAHFHATHPQNPVALAEAAILKAQDEPLAAVDLLQQALELAQAEVPMQIYDALGVVGMALVSAGEITAARAHLMLQFGLSGGKDEQTLQLIVQLQAAPTVHLLLKEQQPLVEPPEDALWKRGFAAALDQGRAGRWRAAAAEFQALAQQAGAWPPISRNIATLASWLARRQEAIAAWRAYSTGEVPLDSAVEAAATAQLLDAEASATIDVIRVAYPVRDTDALLAKLGSHGQSLRMPVDLMSLASEDSPPPKGYFSLLDRPKPATGVGLATEAIPEMLGQVLVFGKQTDREARAELLATRPELAASRRVLESLAGDNLGLALPEEVADQIGAVRDALSLKWYVPDDTPLELRRELMAQGHRAALLTRWANLPQAIFGGATARGAAADPKLRIAVQGAILVLDLAGDLHLSAADYNYLRRELGLAEAGPIDPANLSVLELPYARLARLDVAKLTDNDLLIAFERAQEVRFRRAMNLLGREVLARTSLDAELDKAPVYALMAQLEPDLKQSTSDIAEARRLALAAKKSCARYDLVDLTIRMGHGDVGEADRLLHHIRDQHLREPGIAQALYSLLAQMGLVRPDGGMAGDTLAPQGAHVVPAAAEPAGKLWTPGAEPAAGGKKSAIWTPGMD